MSTVQRKELTPEEKVVILNLRERGESHASIAKVLGKSKSCITKFFKRHQERGTTANSFRPGRPRATEPAIDRTIQSLAANNRAITSTEIQGRLLHEREAVVQSKTIRRRIQETGLFSRRPRFLPYVSPVNVRKRLAFYETHATHGFDYWNRVLFSDESMIRLSWSGGIMRVWRGSKEELSYCCSRPTFKTKSLGLMVWSCMSAAGPGPIVFARGSITARVYKSIIEEHLKPTAERLCGDNWIFQQDNAPVHTANVAKQYFVDANITVLTWPPQSPDLNPIENAWTWLKKRVASRAPRSYEELEAVIADEWAKLPVDYCRKLITSMPNRVGRIQANRGGHTGY